MPRDLPQLQQRIVEAVAAIDRQMLQRVWQELDYRIDICRVTRGGHIEHLYGRTENWSVSPSVDMLPFGVTIPATVPQRSEIPDGLKNYLYLHKKSRVLFKSKLEQMEIVYNNNEAK